MIFTLVTKLCFSNLFIMDLHCPRFLSVVAACYDTTLSPQSLLQRCCYWRFLCVSVKESPESARVVLKKSNDFTHEVTSCMYKS